MEAKDLVSPSSRGSVVKDLPENAAAQMHQEELSVPLGNVLQGLRQVELDAAWKHCVGYSIFVFSFVFITMLANPVWMRFEVQSALLQNLGVTSKPRNSRSKMDFRAIGNYQDFWTWAEQTLVPGIYAYNGTRLSGTPELYSYAIARYNVLISPVRFRQVRVQDTDCSVPIESHSLSRPCWPAYSNDLANSELRPGVTPQTLGSSYKAEGLPSMLGTIIYGHSFGEGGHVVDLELNAAAALSRLRSMISHRWTDEWTRAVSVDINVYNPNYDLATAVRFSVERLLGGQLVPDVHACSCPLSPYSGALGIIRAFFEAVWLSMYLMYLVFMFRRWWRRGYISFFTDFRNYVDIVYMICFLTAFIHWIIYMANDLGTFGDRHPTTFQDLYSVCSTLHNASNFAAFAVVWASVHILTYVGRHPRFEFFRLVFVQSINLVLSFLVILLFGLIAFTFSSLWLFGGRLYQLHTWWQAFGFLIQGLAASFDRRQGQESWKLYQQIRDVSPIIGTFWIVAWVFMLFLIYVQFAILIAVDRVTAAKRQAASLEKVWEEYPLPSWTTLFKSKIRCWIKDPEALELIHKFRKPLLMWKTLLSEIDEEWLQNILFTCYSKGEELFQVNDAMKLFPCRDEAESYRRATSWLKNVMRALRAGAPQAIQRDSTELEVQLLTHKLNRLEEEAFGLSLQLSRLLPEATATSLLPEMI